jgi:hypothetical protein
MLAVRRRECQTGVDWNGSPDTKTAGTRPAVLVVRRQRVSNRRRPPQSVPASSGVSPAVSLRGDLLSCGWPASRSIPRTLAPYRFGAAAAWFVHLAAHQARGRTTDASVVPPPSGFFPASEFDPAMPAPCGCTALPRFHAPTAPPLRSEPPLPELPPPGHVASLPFLPASTPCSRRDLPGIFQPGALPGFLPSELHPAKIGPPLDVPSPPAICVPDLRQPPGRSLGGRGHACMRAPSVGTGPLRVRGLASGVHALRRIGAATFGFLRYASPRLSWAFASLGLSPCPPLVRRSSPFRCRVLVSSRALPAVSPPLVQFWGSVPFRVCSLCSRVSKNRKVGWPLPRLPAPTRFPSSSRLFRLPFLAGVGPAVRTSSPNQFQC